MSDAMLPPGEGPEDGRGRLIDFPRERRSGLPPQGNIHCIRRASWAAKVLTENGHEGEAYTLTGPAAISFHDVAEALSEVLDKDVAYVSILPENSHGARKVQSFRAPSRTGENRQGRLTPEGWWSTVSRCL